MTRALVYEEDIEPRGGVSKKKHTFSWSRRNLGRFIRDQMYRRGFFVSVTKIRPRHDGKISNLSKTRMDGKVVAGIWATGHLAEKAELNASTVRALMQGAHKRSPQLLTVLKVFKALDIAIIAVDSDQANVKMTVRGW